MNFEYFIAKRLTGSKAHKNSISAPIIKIGIAAITIGIIVMLITISTGIGLQRKISEKAAAFNGHVALSNFDSNTSDESQLPISKHQAFSEDFKAIKGIRYMQGVASKLGITRTDLPPEGLIFKGVGPDYNWSVFKEYLVEGKVPIASETISNDVILSSETANRLQLKLNDRFEMVFLRADTKRLPAQVKFTIVGIFNSGFKQLDQSFLLGDIRHIQRINKWQPDEIGNFEIFLDQHNNLNEKGNEIYNNTPSQLKTETVAERYAAIFQWITFFDYNIYGIIWIMIIVAGINMITALLVLILERTQMIGVLKALGANNWSIRKLFLYNASYLVAKGLLWGNILGIGLLLIQKYAKLFPLNPDMYYVTEVPVYLSLDYILLLNLGSFIMCFLMLLIPSYIITKISPIRAIRFQ